MPGSNAHYALFTRRYRSRLTVTSSFIGPVGEPMENRVELCLAYIGIELEISLSIKTLGKMIAIVSHLVLDLSQQLES